MSIIVISYSLGSIWAELLLLFSNRSSLIIFHCNNVNIGILWNEYLDGLFVKDSGHLFFFLCVCVWMCS